MEATDRVILQRGLDLRLTAVRPRHARLGAAVGGVRSERTTVELYGDACTMFEASRRARLAVELGCEPVTVPSPD